jgi:AraC family transcriptional regulator of adaptative response / DNA-3-methyladenine glycosylase II
MFYDAGMAGSIELDFKKIIARRDRRYDGRFYFGVKTTGIYCRPVCPAKPKPNNMLLFRSASEAENAGYRACLRCRPELAPGTKTLDGTMNTVSRALSLINDSAGTEWTIDKLAASLGMTGRHLRRLFDEHLGASPIDVMITRRLHFAKQALQETSQPITDVAFAAGFRSIRRFNEAFADRFKKSPSTFRKTRSAAPQGSLTLRIPVHAPYDWNLVLGYLRRHETFRVDAVIGGDYRRFIPIGKSFGTVLVSKQPTENFLRARFDNVSLLDVRWVLSRLRNLFDTDHNPAHLPSTKTFSGNGVRVPGSFDPFETAVSVILGQMVSTAHAKANVKALVQQFGRKIGMNETQPVFGFPSPAMLANARVEKIGLTRVKAGAIRMLARAVRDRNIDFYSHADFPSMSARLLAIKGIGPWTASIIAMRCLGDPDAFPESDLIVRRALDQKQVDHAGWSSVRAYLTHCLWRDYGQELSKRGAKKS